jgi:glycosyltransferase involved in cell wall biosynthesis
MKVALVASSYLPRTGGLERHVHELARGLARRGAQVEVLTQVRPPRRQPPVCESDGFVVRRFVASIANMRFGIAPGLWEHLRRTAPSLDVVHAHSANAPFALAVAHAGPRRFFFTPHTPIHRLMHWPYARAIRAVVEHAAQTICTSSVEGDLLRARFPWAADRVWVMPLGVDVNAIQTAKPFAESGTVVLTVGRLERHKRVERAIAAMVSLDDTFRLVVVGSGAAWQRLQSYASDLHVASRVKFAGSIPDLELCRWLRTGRVLVALSEQDTSGIQVTEALSAGMPVVASDIPVHREAASHVDGAGVTFVSPEGSPLEVADAISEAARIRVSPVAPLALPSWGTMVDNSLALYDGTAIRRPLAAARGDGMADGEQAWRNFLKAKVALRATSREDGPDMAIGG